MSVIFTHSIIKFGYITLPNYRQPSYIYVRKEILGTGTKILNNQIINLKMITPLTIGEFSYTYVYTKVFNAGA